MKMEMGGKKNTSGEEEKQKGDRGENEVRRGG